MSAHTPGAWIATPDPSSNPTGHTRGDFCIGRDGRPVDEIAVCTGVDDARLIAAAPDSHAANIAMLAAIDEAFDIKAIHDDEYVYDALPSSGVARAYFMARAAVAKAKGA